MNDNERYRQNIEMLKDNWEDIISTVIIPLWKSKYQSMYKSLKLDYDDFESMAGYELTKAMSNFDGSKSNLNTFSTNVLNRKAKTELRSCSDVDKKSSLYLAISLNVPISDEEGGEKIMEIPAPQIQDDSDIERIHRYLTKLSVTEKDIIIFKLLGFDENDIMRTMHIGKKKYLNAVKSMRIYEKASILRERHWRKEHVN